MDPDLPVHVQVDLDTNAWKQSTVSVEEIAAQCKGFRTIYSKGVHVNGAMNSAMQWMRDLGYTGACIFHDDIVFSPLFENRNYFSRSFEYLGRFDASGFSYGHMEAHVGSFGGSRSPLGWDAVDTESEEVWRILCPDGIH